MRLASELHLRCKLPDELDGDGPWLVSGMARARLMSWSWGRVGSDCSENGNLRGTFVSMSCNRSCESCQSDRKSVV